MQLRSKLFYSYLFFVIVYGGFILLPAPSPLTLARYHVSVLGLRLLYLTIIALLAAIWYAGFYGYAKLRSYAELINKTKDGKPVATLTKGIFLLVMWLPVSSVISAILDYIAVRHINLLPAVTIINNYISLILPLAGIIFISLGARGLSELVRQPPKYGAVNIIAIFIIYMGLIDFRLVAATPNRLAVYHLPIWLMLTTLCAPYICMWFMGLLATYEIYHYRLKVAGVVYRKSWSLLALGLGWLIMVSIGFQFLTTVVSHLSGLSIYWILAIIYSLLLILSVGFVLIAAGARSLRRIEEV